jgi:hypothetical protein
MSKYKKDTLDLSDILTELFQEATGGKSAEEIVADEEREQAKKFKRLRRRVPGIKRDRPVSWGESARSLQRIEKRRAALKKHPVTLKLPPFPPLKMTLSEWAGKDVLPAWAGTQERQGGYTSRSSRMPSKGIFTLNIPRLDDDDTDPAPPAAAQIAAYEYLKKHDEEVAQTVLEALLKYYMKVRRQWLTHHPELQLPEIRNVATLRKNVGLGIIHMFDIAKGGVAYIGLEIGCTWDDEHGAGVVLHKSRVIAVGQADTSFGTHHAVKDGGKALRKQSTARRKR